MMKKYIKSLLVFCSVFTLASCSGQNTPTEPEENLTNFEKGLKKAKESVSLAGQLTQTRKFYSSELSNLQLEQQMKLLILI